MLIRRLVAEAYRAGFRWSCRKHLRFERFGTPYGGWQVPVDVVSPETVVVSAGAGEDISFDLELIRRYRMTVHIVDPTPRARAHVLGVIHAVEGRTPADADRAHDPSEMYDLTDVGSERIKYLDCGLWNKDQVVRFYAPANPLNVSHSAVNLQKTSEYFEAECLRFNSICARQGISAVEILKLDVEGAEHDVIQDVIAGSLSPRIICVEFDEAPHWKELTAFKRVRSSIEDLDEAGYDLCCVDSWNFTFIQRTSLR